MLAKEENKMNTAIQAEYEKSLNDHYLVLKNEQWEENNYQFSMITENQIPYFLPLEIRSIDGRNDLYYKISSLQPIAKLYKNREMKLEDVKTVLMGLTKAFMTAQEYMLEEKHIVILPEYIFMNTKDRQIQMLFDPYFEKEAEDSLKELADYLIVKIDHADQNAVMMGYQFYRTVREDNFVINDIVRLYTENPAKMEDIDDNEETIQQRENGSFFDVKYQEGQENYNHQNYNQYKKTKDDSKDKFYTKTNTNQTDVQNKNSNRLIPRLKRIITIILAVISGILFFGGIGSYHSGQMEKVIWGIIFLISFLSIGMEIIQKVLKKPRSDFHGDTYNHDSYNHEYTGKSENNYDDIFADMRKNIDFTDADIQNQYVHQDVAISGNDWKGNIREYIPEEIKKIGEIEEIKVIEKIERISDNIQDEETYGKTVMLTTDGQMAENILVETRRGKETRHYIESFPYTIGKVKDNVDLALNDLSVSRIHARIIEENGRVYVQDCNSTNGTYVNGILLDKEEKIPIERDDEIGIGRVVLLYQ